MSPIAESSPPTVDGLPRPAAWRIDAAAFRALTPTDQCEQLSRLAGEGDGYWVLHQGAMAPGSQRQLLTNLDSVIALRAALTQRFGEAGAPAALTVQRLPPQRAAGVLFARHPRRPDLDHIVVEVASGGPDIERVILHADGHLAWSSGDPVQFGPLLPAFHDLARRLNNSSAVPMAAEWVWDGQRLWVVQMMTIGTLPVPTEAWTRRSPAAGGTQVITPLWYTLFGRWLKSGFWRPLGQQAGWKSLANVEPFRRQHSHLYLNSQFAAALQRWRGYWRSTDDLPPGWRQPGLPLAPAVSALGRWWFSARLYGLRRRLVRLRAQSPKDPWLLLMALDQVGEKLARLYGQLHLIWLPEQQSRLTSGLSRRQVARLRALGRGQSPSAEQALDAVGLDPVWPRWCETAGDQQALIRQLASMPAARKAAMLAMGEDHSPLGKLNSDLEDFSLMLTARLREVLRSMAVRLHQQGILKHPDDVFFLYFDELWQCWRNTPRPGLGDRLAQRKVRYLTDGHSGPPEWIIDQVGYGTSAFGSENRQPLLNGYGLVSGQVRAAVRRIGSGWQLNQLQPGDIVVLDHCEPGWLPWLCLAGGLVLAHRNPLDPAVALARALSIPTVWGVDDAMHSVVDGDVMDLDGDQGEVR
ncbi:MAG: PEP-utilizing enzyme [Alcanivoracaceae bacterium]